MKFCQNFVQKASLQGQAVHWIGAQFCVCMFLDSSENSSKHDQTLSERSKGNESTKEEEQYGSVFVAETVHNSQNAQFCLVMIFQFKNCV